MSSALLLLLSLTTVCSFTDSDDSQTASTDTGPHVEVLPPVDTGDLPPLTHPLQISEICAANRDLLHDEDGDSPDWIELHNPHDVAVDLTGTGLSDDPDDPWRFTLPSETLAPGAFLLVYASGKTDRPLHAPFALSSLGETLTLTDTTGRVHDKVETGRLFNDHSLGRDPDSGELLIYLSPTPQSGNTTEGRPGLTAPPVLSPDGGFHEGSVQVSLTAPSEEATVHVLVGATRAPRQDDPTYTGPFTLTGAESVVVRAIAIEEGLWPSRATTRTFFLDRPIDLPVWSINSDDDALFAEEGIYTEDNVYDDQEIDAHLEFYESDGTLVQGTDAGLKLHGGASQAFPQKSLRLLFRNGYGQAPFAHALFPESSVSEFHRLILRNAGHDHLLAELRDPFTHQLVRDLDLDVQGWRPAIVYLNGVYWGLYHTREKQDRFYLASHHGADPEQVDLLEYDGTTVSEGDSDDYLALVDYVVQEDMAQDDLYAVAEAWLDVPAYLLYQAIEIYSANYDWPGNNIKFWRPRSPEGRWRWALYDTESGWGNWQNSGEPDYDSVAHATNTRGLDWPNPAWSTALFRNLLENRVFRDQFLNTYADLLNTRLRPENATSLLYEMADQLAEEMTAHVALWGSTTGWWDYQVDEAAWFLDHRQEYAWDHLLRGFALEGTWTLALSVDPPGAGSIALAVHRVEDTFEGSYFLGVPVQLEAIPAEGWAFTGWSDDTLGSASTVSLAPDGDRAVEALFAVAP